MKKETALDFLLYSYFGVTSGSSDEELLKAAANRAYQDAASHVLSVRDEKEKVALREKGCQTLMDFFRQLPVKDYDTAHQALCEKLEALYEGKTTNTRGFTCGVAQKWVNMTMKYVFVLSALVDKPEFSSKYADQLPEKDLHIPLDSYMLEYIAQKNHETFSGSPCVKIPAKNKNCETYYSSDKALAWSKYPDYDTYMKVQSGVREKLCSSWETPLDWEGPAWIEVAKKRTNK